MLPTSLPSLLWTIALFTLLNFVAFKLLRANCVVEFVIRLEKTQRIASAHLFSLNLYTVVIAHNLMISLGVPIMRIAIIGAVLCIWFYLGERKARRVMLTTQENNMRS